MILPRVLIIDDQYGWDTAARKKIKKDIGLFDSNSGNEGSKGIADVVFCPGQSKADGVVSNDYELIRKTIADLPRSSAEWALVLLDVRFDSGEIGVGDIPAGLPGDDSFGEKVRSRLLSEFPELPLVMLTSKHQSELQDQEYPYLSKSGLTSRIFTQCLLLHGRLTTEQKRKLLGLDANSVASSPPSIKLFREADSIADKDAPVLILGESGAGKEVLAHYIHDRSERKAGPFVAINVAAIPNELVEAELFGIEARVATSVDRRPGKFELASGGTLFLDEIGDMPLPVQAKVLRALQENEILRIGSRQPIAVNVRVLSATSRDISNLLAQKAFRLDLLRRISAVTITVPPLRERQEDIIPLSEAFLRRFSLQYKKTGINLGSDAKATLCKHPFFGNVGELEHILHRLVGTVGNNRVITGSEMEEALATSMSTLANSPVISPSPDTNPCSPDHDAGTPANVTSLNELIQIVQVFQVDRNDCDLAGAKSKIDEAMRILLKKLAGASLEVCRDQRTKELNRQASMQLLTGDYSLKGKGPGRVINEILGRTVESQITNEDLEILVNEWRKYSGK